MEVCDGPVPRPEESYRVCMSLSVVRPNNNPLPHNEYVKDTLRKKFRKKERNTEVEVKDIISSFQSTVIFHYSMFLINLNFLYEVMYIFKFILKESLKLCAHVNKRWDISVGTTVLIKLFVYTYEFLRFAGPFSG
jgi:hypothetical protein